MKSKVYIDGQAGTTGLRIREWLAGREDVALLTIPEAHRKDDGARREHLLDADLAVLCLPDAAAVEAAEWAGNGSTRVLDASTAHRVADGWTYGLPELEPGQRDRIRGARFVSNPGCYPTGAVMLVRPLIDAGLLAPDVPLSIHAVSGYSGGGRGLIESWEDANGKLAGLPYAAPYALDRPHKHLPEMMRYGGLTTEPQFVPAVGAFRSGMRVQVPVNAALLGAGVDGRRVWEALEARYRDETFVRVAPLEPAGGFDEFTLDPRACNDTNAVELRVAAHPSGHLLLVALLDNLGKGASGAAIQNMNLMLGLPEDAGLPRESRLSAAVPVRVEAERLRELGRRALLAVGVPQADAIAGADILWTGEMMGISTHGVRRLTFYVQRILDGAIDPDPDIRTEETGTGISVIDGGQGLGPVVGSRGVAEAIRHARAGGMGFVTCRNSHHFGPVAPYALRAVEAGLVAFMGTNAQPVMAPWRGSAVAHGNNPVAFAAPRRNGPPFILDIAQSVVAYSKLRHAHEAGESIPDGWAADSHGRPTNDPAVGMRGSVLPIGAHKGYGLALAVEILAAALSGGALGREVNALYRRDRTPQGVCHFFMVIDPERTVGRDAFLERIDALCDMMKSVDPVNPHEPVLIPGEPEWAAIEDRREHGVPLPAEWLEDIERMARGESPQGMPAG